MLILFGIKILQLQEGRYFAFLLSYFTFHFVHEIISLIALWKTKHASDNGSLLHGVLLRVPTR